MMEDMSDIEKLIWIELRFGLSKTVKGSVDRNQINDFESELTSMLTRYHSEFSLSMPVPRIITSITNHKIYFIFVDKKDGKRILLGDWLSKRNQND
jgi:hypothetical protein